MHAGEASNCSTQRAYGDKSPAATGETIMPAEIQNEKCTPAGRLPIYVRAGPSFSRQPLFIFVGDTAKKQGLSCYALLLPRWMLNSVYA